jgi:hypothetical protein
MHINRRIERFLRDNAMPPTLFGRLAVHDPRLVLDIRMGRNIRDTTAERLIEFMDSYRITPNHKQVA